jgi:hypothetical protein
LTTTIGLNLFSVPVAVVDVTYEAVAGIDKQTIRSARTIQAVVDTSDKRKLEQIFGGSVSDADIGITPADGSELFFLDAYFPGDERKQSLIAYMGWQYRIIANSDYTNQAGAVVYLGSRHITQDLV